FTVYTSTVWLIYISSLGSFTANIYICENACLMTTSLRHDGLPMNNCTDVTANAFKYTAKELSLFRGLPVCNYTARHTLPQINRFRTMDRECESFFHLSPYTFCGGDLINFFDPTGCTPELTTRIEGAFQAGLGLAEMYTGSALCSTGIGSVVGVPLVVHGADNVATGGTKVITGEDQQTMTSQTVAAGAEALGASKENAAAIGQAADTAIGVVGDAGPAIAKVSIKLASKYVGKIGSTATAKIAKTTNVRNNYRNGKAAERAVIDATAGEPKRFNTDLGRRDVDVHVSETRTAIEDKTGEVCLSPRIQSQANKDISLLKSGQVNSVQWQFYPSPITGKVGPTKPLEQFLQQNNIGITIINQ
ncbi:MAG: DUF4225 domain-containing protein, partial [Duncaniella sp.]|nr:DUF4225 domain-containing protein [Duncaniella sp.]